MCHLFQIYAEASLVFPLLVGQTFATNYHKEKKECESPEPKSE